MPETILLEVSDGIATLTLNQPAKRNPMTVRMGEEIARALHDLEAREDVRVLVVTGAGESFCAGGDMGLIEDNTRRSVQQSRQVMLDYYDRYLSLLRVSIPTIAAIHGYAIGGGLAIALAGMEGALAGALDYEAFCQAISYTTADLKEGVAAHRERRQPRFQGQ
jgi:enoyl-CoA hydratase